MVCEHADFVQLKQNVSVQSIHILEKNRKLGTNYFLEN